MRKTDIFAIRFEKVIPKYYQIERHIKYLISSGRLKPGDKLPPEEIIAEKLGIHRWTVNKALNHLVNEGLLYRNKSQGTYITSYKAENTKTIAVILYHIDNPFYSRIVKSIEEEASKKGYHLILCNSLGDEEKEVEYVVRLTKQRKVDGILICPRNLGLTSPVFDILNNVNLPFVVFPQVDKKKARGLNYVITDDKKGSYIAVRHLIKKGHREIGFVAPAEWDWKKAIFILDRWEGYRQAMEEEGIEVNDRFIIGTEGVEMEDGLKVAMEKIEAIKNFTALFCVGDLLAIGILKGLERKGVKIPDEISIIGFDNIEMAGHFDICLTTVEQPTYLIGKKATEILINQIEGKRKSPEHVILQPKLIIRSSVEKRVLEKV